MGEGWRRKLVNAVQEMTDEKDMADRPSHQRPRRLPAPETDRKQVKDPIVRCRVLGACFPYEVRA